MTKRERKTLFSLAPQPQRLRRQATLQIYGYFAALSMTKFTSMTRQVSISKNLRSLVYYKSMTKISRIKKAERVSPPALSGTQARSKASKPLLQELHYILR